MIIEQAFMALPEIFFGNGYKYRDDNLLEAGINSAFTLSLLQELNGRNIENPINSIKAESTYDLTRSERCDLFLDLGNMPLVPTFDYGGFKRRNYLEVKYFKQHIGSSTNNVGSIIIDLYRLILLPPADLNCGRYFLHVYKGNPTIFLAQKYHWLLYLTKPGTHDIIFNFDKDLAQRCPKIDINLTVTNYTIPHSSDNFFFTLSKIDNFQIFTTDTKGISLYYNVTIPLRNNFDTSALDEGKSRFLRYLEKNKPLPDENLNKEAYNHINNAIQHIIENDENKQIRLSNLCLKIVEKNRNKEPKDGYDYKEYSQELFQLFGLGEIQYIIRFLLRTKKEIAEIINELGALSIIEYIFNQLMNNYLFLHSLSIKDKELNNIKKNILQNIEEILYKEFINYFNKFIENNIIRYFNNNTQLTEKINNHFFENDKKSMADRMYGFIHDKDISNCIFDMCSKLIENFLKACTNRHLILSTEKLKFSNIEFKIYKYIFYNYINKNKGKGNKMNFDSYMKYLNLDPNSYK